MELIENNLAIINVIQQAQFDILFELNIAIEITNNENINNEILLELLDKIINYQHEMISRNSIIEFVNQDIYSKKELFLMIFCWGGYFKIFRAQKQQNIVSLITFFNNHNEAFFDNMVNNIENVNLTDDNSIMALFNSFNNENKISGVGYAFYTKLFFYFSVNNSLPILDQWLSKSFIYLVLNDENLTENLTENITSCIYNNNPFAERNKSFIIKRRKNFYYLQYVRYLNQISNEHNLGINNLETFLFGWDLRQNFNNGYVNPRLTYINFFNNHF